MKNKIRLLSPDIINKIAAGEVVERPASIVKELLENAIDANATEIILSLEKGGIDSISVSDNGLGMNAADTKLALTQHATSKITTEADLYNINTLGFRGEALASIASVSEILIHTYDNINPPVLAKADAKGIETKLGQGRSQGTTVTVSKIFLHIPVRRKFLKSETTEYKYILDTFNQIVLANNKIGFKLIKNNKQIAYYPRTQDFAERITQVFPLKTNELIPIFYDGPLIKVDGFITHPQNGGKYNNQQYIFINTRFIKNALINKAVKEGYGTTLMREEQPSYFLTLNISPDIVDVNVHPRKLEVRFSEPGMIFSIVRKSIETALRNDLKNKFQQNFSNNSKNNQRKHISSIQESIDFSKELLTSINSIKPIKSFDILRNEPKVQISSPISDGQLASITINNENNKFLQIFNTYIVIAKDDKVLFIDQHAAHERINFERITIQFESSKSLSKQALLIPETIKLTTSELITIKENLQLFESIGFKLEDFKKTSLNISEIPTIINSSNIKPLFLEILADIENSEAADYSARWREIKDKLIGTLACHSSIKAGEIMHKSNIERLISDLFTCKIPYSCPHGRPIIFEMSKFQLEKNFKRKV